MLRATDASMILSRSSFNIEIPNVTTERKSQTGKGAKRLTYDAWAHVNHFTLWVNKLSSRCVRDVSSGSASPQEAMKRIVGS